MHLRNLCWLLFLSYAACQPSPTSEADAGPPPYTQQGEASFYANVLHGNRTADGSRYHRDSLTAAHPSLPLGTVVSVRNLENDSLVEVQINDRGPYAGRRILDLSRAAARQLGFISDGVTQVEITVIEPAPGYTVADSAEKAEADTTQVAQ